MHDKWSNVKSFLNKFKKSFKRNFKMKNENGFCNREMCVLLEFLEHKIKEGIRIILVQGLKKESGLSYRGFRKCIKFLREIGAIEYKQVNANKKLGEKAPFMARIIPSKFNCLIERYQQFEEGEVSMFRKNLDIQISQNLAAIQKEINEKLGTPKEIPNNYPYIEKGDYKSNHPNGGNLSAAPLLVDSIQLSKAESLFIPKGYNPLCRKQREDLGQALSYHLQKGESIEDLFKALTWKKEKIENKASPFCAPATFLMNSYNEFKSKLPFKQNEDTPSKPIESVLGGFESDFYVEEISKETNRLQKEIEENPKKYEVKHPELFTLKGHKLILYIQNAMIDKKLIRERVSERKAKVKQGFNEDAIKIEKKEPFSIGNFLSKFMEKEPTNI